MSLRDLKLALFSGLTAGFTSSFLSVSSSFTIWLRSMSWRLSSFFSIISDCFGAFVSARSSARRFICDCCFLIASLLTRLNVGLLLLTFCAKSFSSNAAVISTKSFLNTLARPLCFIVLTLSTTAFEPRSSLAFITASVSSFPVYFLTIIMRSPSQLTVIQLQVQPHCMILQ